MEVRYLVTIDIKDDLGRVIYDGEDVIKSTSLYDEFYNRFKNSTSKFVHMYKVEKVKTSKEAK